MLKIFKNFKKQVNKLLIINIILILSAIPSFANNLNISNVRLGSRNPSNNTVDVVFNLSWNNAWKTKINHDAIWMTVRLNKTTENASEQKLCSMTLAGKNPVSVVLGTSSDIEAFIPNDQKGIFIRPAIYGKFEEIVSQDVKVQINYGVCGFSDTDQIKVNVYGLEMVYIPKGAFYAGDETSDSSLKQGVGDNDPWSIQNSSLINVTASASNGFYYASGNNADENATGSSFEISDEFPNGYDQFYVMKYEINEGDWVNFVNALTSAEKVNLDITDDQHKNSDSVKYRNTIQCSGSPLLCSTARPQRAVNYLSWMDVAAFFDWMSLRPITELEFEKMARGPVYPISGEFAWGNTNIVAAIAISNGNEQGDETVETVGANAVYGNQTFSGGDAVTADYQKGALRSGIFAIIDSDRILSGAGYYGVMELSGNVSEMVVTIGNPYGRAFAGTNGDGVLSSLAGYEGLANELDWPGIDGIPARGVTGALGSGYKGGAWNSVEQKLKVSNRSEAALAAESATILSGGRGARTYEE